MENMWYALDMEEINVINLKYKFKIKQVNDTILHIDSGTDEWVLELETKSHHRHKNLILRHKNHRRNLRQHHEHRRFYDIKWVFGAIHNHELRWFRKFNKMNEMLAMIKNLKEKDSTK